jgi:hypothetical protein
MSEYYETLATRVRERIRTGKFRKMDPLLAARGFVGMIMHHFLIQELFGGKHYQDFDTEKVSKTLTQIWLAGMVKSGVPEHNANSLHRNGDLSSLKPSKNRLKVLQAI